MKKIKNNFFIILILIFSSIFITTHYINTMSNIEDDIPVIREYIFDLLSLSKIDINNYSINTNFEEKYSDKDTEEIWSSSMTYSYISKNKNKQYQLKKSKMLSNNIENVIKEIHIKNIDFFKNNLIPLASLDGDNSDNELEKYIDNTSKNKEKLIKEISLLDEKMKRKINDYIKFVNIYKKNEKLSIEKEEQSFNEYFEKEYESLLNKQINSKIDTLIK